MRKDILAIIIAAVGTSLILHNQLAPVGSLETEDIPIHVYKKYSEWRSKFKKLNFSPNEQNFRLKIFYETYKRVEEVNSQKDLSYRYGLTKFADWSEEEKARLGTLEASPIPENLLERGVISEEQRVNIAESIDWREKGVVGRIKERLICGSSWAFGTLAGMQSIYAIATGDLVELAEQQLVDCSRDYGNQGCYSGQFGNSYNYIRDNGITSEDHYPWVSKEQLCKYSPGEMPSYYVKGFKQYSGQQADVLTLLQTSPIVTSITRTYFFDYIGGVYDGPCDTHYPHAVEVVGYGEDNGKKYWLFKNIWGEDWGEKGYGRVIRQDSGPNRCGIGNSLYVPYV